MNTIPDNVKSTPQFQEQSPELLHTFAELRDKLASLKSLPPLLAVRMMSQMMWTGAETMAKLQLLIQSGLNDLQSDLGKDVGFAEVFLEDMGKNPPDYASYAGTYQVLGADGQPVPVGGEPEIHTFTVNGEEQDFYLVKDQHGAEFYIPANEQWDAARSETDGFLTFTLDGTEEQGVPIPVGLLAYSTEGYDHTIPMSDTGLFSFVNTPPEQKEEWLTETKTDLENNKITREEELTGQTETILAHVKNALALTEASFSSWGSGIQQMGSFMQNAWRN